MKNKSLQRESSVSCNNNSIISMDVPDRPCPPAPPAPRPRCLATVPGNIEDLIKEFKNQDKICS